MAYPLVSIIIPAFNEQNVIERLLLSINNQTYKNTETIVIDDNSSDKTLEVAKKYTKKAYKQKHAERSVQRNYGASAATGKYLLFLDADMELTPKVVEQCVQVAEKSLNVGCVVIPETPVARSFWEKIKAFERDLYNKFGDEFTDAARFFPKTVFNEVGGYDEKITGPEDWDLPETIKKKGYACIRIDSRILHHERVPSLLKLAKKKFYYALKTSVYLEKHGISPFSAKTVYFLRPVFYKQWRELLTHPVLTFWMFLMLSIEGLAGLAGFIWGKYFSKI
jgi:glycosyltransferase involved in cell wall biosynthesis